LKQSHHLNITASKLKVFHAIVFHFNISITSFSLTQTFQARLFLNAIGKLSIIFVINFSSLIGSKAPSIHLPSGIATSIDQTIGTIEFDAATKLAILSTDFVSNIFWISNLLSKLFLAHLKSPISEPNHDFI
jgi:hypothetical protein